MPIDATTIKIFVYVGTGLVSVVAFFLIRLLNRFEKIGDDVSEIKGTLKAILVKHDFLEKEVQRLDDEIKFIKNKI